MSYARNICRKILMLNTAKKTEKQTVEIPTSHQTTLSEHDIYRINMTVSCHDANIIPKTDNAGRVIDYQNTRVQLMHNGVKILEHCYCGPWMTAIIEQLKGCHEPQEELVYYHILQKLKQQSTKPNVLELGAYWSYYTLWALQEFPDANAFLVEPDPNNLNIGKKNFELNNQQGTFHRACIEQEAKATVSFFCEDGQTHKMPAENLPSLFNRFNLDYLDILLADIQGAETGLLTSAKDLFKTGKVGYAIISTHHHTISHDPLTHQKCLTILKDCGAHIIAEHSVAESFSGDGLIAVSFKPEDADFTVPISYCRASESLFPIIEKDLARLLQENSIQLIHGHEPRRFKNRIKRLLKKALKP